jgi:hypothetical protein
MRHSFLLLVVPALLAACQHSVSTDPAPAQTPLTKPAPAPAAGSPGIIHDSVQIATAGPLRGESACRAWEFQPADSGATSAVLTVSLVDTLVTKIDSTNKAASTKRLELWLGGRWVGNIEPGSAHTVIHLPLAELTGTSLTTLYATPSDGQRWYCSVPMRTAPRAGDTKAPADHASRIVRSTDLPAYVATGIEFASADGFRSQQTRVPVVAKWQGDVMQKSRLGISFVFSGDAGSVEIPQAFTACMANRPVPVLAADTMSFSDAARVPGICRVRHIESIGGDTYLKTDYTLRPDTLREDTTSTTGVSWTLSGLLRMEVALPGGAMFLGVPLYGAFQTNPAGAFSHSIGQSWRSGLTFRQLDPAGHQRFEAQALYGAAPRFSALTTTEFAHPFTIGDTATTVVVTRQLTTAKDWLFRGYFTPIDGFMVRAVVEFNPSDGKLATIAMLKQIDIGAALKSLGIQ